MISLLSAQCIRYRWLCH